MCNNRLFSCITLFIALACLMVVSTARANIVEEQVKAFLEKSNVMANVVNYDSENNKLVLEGVTKSNFLVKNVQLKIDKILVDKPNLKTFDITASSETTVADDILFKNVSLTFFKGNNFFTLKIGSTSITKWTQNIGKLILTSATGTAYELIKEILTLSVQRLSLSGIVLDAGSQRSKFKFGALLNSFTLDNITSKHINSCTIEKFSAYLGEGLSKKNSISVQFDTFTWHPITLPTLNSYYFIWAAISGELEKKKDTIQIINAIKYVNDVLKLSLDTKFELKNLKAQYSESYDTGDKGISLTVKEILNSNVFHNNPVARVKTLFKDIHLNGKFDKEIIDIKIDQISSVGGADLLNYTFAFSKNSIENFVMLLDGEHLSQANKDTLLWMFGKQIQGNANLDLNLFNDKDSFLELSVDSPNVGKVTLNLAAKIPGSILQSGLNFYNFQLFVDVLDVANWLAAPIQITTAFTYEDKGLYPRVVKFIHKTKAPHLSLEQFQEQILVKAMQKLKEKLTPYGAAHLPAVEQCLKNPGILSITGSNRAFSSPIEIFAEPHFAIKYFEYKSDCKQGTSLIEQMRELQ